MLPTLNTTGARVSDRNLIARIDDERNGVIELLRKVVELESPSTDKSRVDRLASFIADRLRSNGIDPHVAARKAVGDIVWGEWGNGSEGQILVLCHIDTVWEPGSLARNPFRVEEGRIYGPGIFDMKSGVTATLKIQEYLAQGWIRPRKKVHFLYTTDEEIGSQHSRALIEDLGRQSDLVLLTEPPLPGGALKTFRKGVGDFVLKIHGRAAHAGLDPEKGINAIEELVAQVQNIHALSQPELGTGVIVTVVRGGLRENVIPEYAEANIDARFRTIEEGQRVERSMRQLKAGLPGARLEVIGGINRPPMIRTARTQQLFEKARTLAGEIGIDLQEGESGGGSDGSFTAALGIPTLDGLGITGNGAHAVNEHIELDALAPRIALLAKLIEGL